MSGLSVSLLAQLAESTCNPHRRPRIIQASNQGGELVTWEKAPEMAEAGVAIAGVAQAQILALDLDTDGMIDEDLDRDLDDRRGAVGSPGTGKGALRARLELQSIVDDLLASGYSPVLLRSGRTGNRHLFCRLTDRACFEEMVLRARSVGIDVRRGSALIRPPGWPHRNGYAVSVAQVKDQTFSVTSGQSDQAWFEVLRALVPTSRLGESAEKPDGLNGDVDANPRLPQRLWELVRFGDRDRRYTTDGRVDGSRVVMAICNLAVLSGLSRSHLWNLLVDQRNAGGLALRRRRMERGDQATRAWFDKTWDKALRGARSRGPLRERASTDRYLEALERLVARTPFPGTSGSTDRTVLATCHRIAKDRHASCLALSLRELSVEAGVTTTTAGRSLRRLRAAGWLRLIAVSNEDRSASYKLSVPRDLELDWGSDSLLAEQRACAQEDDSSLPHGGRGTVALVRETNARAGWEVAGHDAFHRYALGKGCLETWQALGALGPASAHDIGRLTGKTASTVRRHLVKLADVGLVERGEALQSWRLRSQDIHQSLDQIAEDCGTAGLRELRIERYRRDRENYRRWLDSKLQAGVAAETCYETSLGRKQLILNPCPPAARPRGRPRSRPLGRSVAA